MGYRWSGRKSALPVSRVVVSCPWTAAGSSLYIHRVTPDGLQNPEAGSYTCPAWFLPFPILQYKLHISWRFMSTGLNPPLGLGPLTSQIVKCHTSCLNGLQYGWLLMSIIRPLLGGLYLVVISPTLGPRLIWTCSCQSSTLRKIPSSTSTQKSRKPPWRHLPRPW